MPFPRGVASRVTFKGGAKVQPVEMTHRAARDEVRARRFRPVLANREAASRARLPAHRSRQVAAIRRAGACCAGRGVVPSRQAKAWCSCLDRTCPGWPCRLVRSCRWTEMLRVARANRPGAGPVAVGARWDRKRPAPSRRSAHAGATVARRPREACRATMRASRHGASVSSRGVRARRGGSSHPRRSRRRAWCR